MNFWGIVFFFVTLSLSGHAHNIKILNSQSSDLNTNGIDAAFNNETYISDSDTFFEGYVGYSRTKNSQDDSNSDNKGIGAQAITPSFWSFGINSSLYENTAEELKTKTIAAEVGKKFFYGTDDVVFKPNFGFRLKHERIGLDQSKTFARRKFDFSLDQTANGLSISVFPIKWFEITTSYYQHTYDKDVETIKSRLSRSEVIRSLFSNVQNTLDSLSVNSKSLSLRFLPLSWLDATFTRTYSDDLISDTEYYIDSVDVGFYYFSRVYIFIAAGDHYSSVDTSKSMFTEMSIQINF